MPSRPGVRRLPRGPGIGIVFSITGGLLGFLASSWFPYGWLITYPLIGMLFGALLAVWFLFPWEDPRDWRSRFWRQHPEPTHGRIAELDALRGFAVTMVCGCHLWPESRIFFYGWSGVDLFFVLSGYLITQITLRNGQEPGFLKAFYARRTLRIWPIYYLGLTVIVVLALPGAVAGMGRNGTRLLSHLHPEPVRQPHPRRFGLHEMLRADMVPGARGAVLSPLASAPPRNPASRLAAGGGLLDHGGLRDAGSRARAGHLGRPRRRTCPGRIARVYAERPPADVRGAGKYRLASVSSRSRRWWYW